MEVKQVLHMNKGDGQTSYAKNSTVQRKTLSIVQPFIEEAVVEILSSNTMGIESMGVADLGCSSGPNTLLLISHIMDVVHHAKLSQLDYQPSTSTAPTELRVYLNDLFSNDFNTIFMSLPEFYAKLKQDHDVMKNPFISAVPGSFYGPLFPRGSLHFVHSSFSLHWLSQVPSGINNKGKIYISKSSPQSVLDAYSMQFKKDFLFFLRYRGQEMVDGGRMVLSFMGRPSSDPTSEQSTFYQWELLAHALMAMVLKGRIEEEKLDSFNIPYYASCADELNEVLQQEGSFIRDRLETFEVGWDIGDADLSNQDKCTFDDDQMVTSSTGRRVAISIRVVAEAMLESHFGKVIMYDLFQKYAELVSNHLSITGTSRPKYTVLVISLVRKKY